MKKFHLNTLWLQHPRDLLDAFSKKDLFCQILPKGQKILVSKKGDTIKARSIVGVDLTKRVKSLAAWKNIKCDFEIVTVMSHNKDDFYAFDIISIGGKSLTTTKLEDRYDHLARIDPEEAYKLAPIQQIPIRGNIEFSKSGFCAFIRRKDSLLTESDTSKSFYFLKDPNIRKVIIKDFYYGNRVGASKEVIFRCFQYRNDKMTLVGKLRIDNPQVRKKVIQSIERKKRTAVLTRVTFDKRNKKRYSKLVFDSIIYDESFRNIVVDSEAYFRPIVIVDIRAQKRTVVLEKTLSNNLNMLSGVI